MNAHDDMQHDHPHPARPLPGVPPRHSEIAIHGDPSRSGVRGHGFAPAPGDVETASPTAGEREVTWVLPSDLPKVFLAPVLGKAVERTLTAQSNLTRPAVRAPAVAARATARQVRARRAASRVKGLGR